MLKGRSDHQDAVFRHSSAYLYAAPQIVLPASLLLFAAGLSTKNRLLMWVAVFSMIPVVIFSGAQGSRITLLPLLFAPLVYWMLATNRRPRWFVVILCSYILLTVGVAYLRDTRQEQHSHARIAELGRSLTDPTAEVRALVGRGVDNDMFESLGAELTVVGTAIPTSPLDFGKRLLAKPIPSVLWRGKPLDPDENLNNTLFPNEPTRASSSTGILDCSTSRVERLAFSSAWR